MRILIPGRSANVATQEWQTKPVRRPNTPGIKMQQHEEKKLLLTRPTASSRSRQFGKAIAAKEVTTLKRKPGLKRKIQSDQQKRKSFYLSSSKGDVHEVALQGEVGDPVEVGNLKDFFKIR